MPVDIEICELTLAGMCEPSASWTKDSGENIIISFEEILNKRNAVLKKYYKNEQNEQIIQIIILTIKYALAVVAILPTTAD